MKTFLTLTAVLVLNYVGFTQKELLYNTQAFSANVKRVDAKTVSGSVSIVATESKDYKVEVILTPNNWSDSPAPEVMRERAKNFDITIKEEGEVLRLEAKTKAKQLDWKKSVSVSFRIHSPAQMQTDFMTSGGSINYKGVGGSHKFITSGGSLNVQDLTATVDGTTSGGSINVANSVLQGKLTSSGGSIRAENVKGKLMLHTSGGSLNFKNLNGDFNATTSGGSLNGSSVDGSLIASTSGGSLHLDDMRCSLRAENGGGNMTVGISKLGNYLELNNSSGDIAVTLPANAGMNLSVSASDISLGNFPGIDSDAARRSFKGQVGGGGTPVTIRAGSGRVKVSLAGKKAI